MAWGGRRGGALRGRKSAALRDGGKGANAMLGRLRSGVDRRAVALAAVPVVGAVLAVLTFGGVAGAVTTATIAKAAATTTTAAKTGLSHGITVGVLVFGVVFAVMLIWKFARRGSKA